MPLLSGITRRALFSKLLIGIGAMAAAQKAILEDGKAVICKGGDSVICPACHQKTCKIIDAPIVVGNDSHDYPDSSQLFDYHILRCELCHAAFFRE